MSIGSFSLSPAEVMVVKKKVSEGLQSVLEESDDVPHSKNGTTPSRHKKKRVSPYRMSSVIKLEYDLSNPVYPLVKHLILKYILGWIKPDRGDTKDAPPPSPSVSQQPSLVPRGAELMRNMWFTSRDNVNLLLEVCRQGFQMSTADPRQVDTLRGLSELYLTWVAGGWGGAQVTVRWWNLDEEELLILPFLFCACSSLKSRCTPLL